MEKNPPIPNKEKPVLNTLGENISSKVSNKIGDLLGVNQVNNRINKTYANFVLGFPISILEKNELIDFLKSDNNSFIKKTFADDNGKLDIKIFIDNILNELENYNLVVNIGEGKDIECIGNREECSYYSYDLNSQKGIFIISEGKIIISDHRYDMVKLLNNGLIFCNQQKAYFPNNGDSIYYNSIGALYIFNGEKIIEKTETLGITHMNNTLEKDLFITDYDSPFFGLIQIDIEQGNIKINELLKQSYSDIKFQNDSTNTIIYGLNLDNNKIEVYKKVNNKLQLIHTTKSSNYNFEIQSFGDYYRVKDDSGVNIYKIDKEYVLSTFDDRLLQMEKTSNIESLLKGLPTLIQNKNESGIYIFDRNTSELLKIIDTGDNDNLELLDGDIMHISHKKEIYIFFWKNGKLYKFKKGYTYNYVQGFIKKGLLGKKINISHNYEEMKDYLEEVTLPFKI